MKKKEAKAQLRLDWEEYAVGILKHKKIDWTHHDKDFDVMAKATDIDTAYTQMRARFQLMCRAITRSHQK